MSNREDINPFADPNDVNPFADPSIVNQTKQPTLDDYNPFDGVQQQQTQQPTAFSTPAQPSPPSYTATLPATIEPVSSQAQQPYQAKPFGGQDDGMLQRQQELERKAAELERKEQELNQIRASGNNFPPFPKFCCVQPCFYHDINLEIPSASQKTCKLLFYIWQLYIFTLLFNLLSSIAYIGAGGSSSGETLGLAILYFIVNIPCSFLFWYRPIYKALKNDSSFSYMVFFFVFFCQILFTIVMCIGIPGVSCGWINSITTFKDDSEGVGIMMFICATLWTLLAALKIILLKKVHSSYRSSGASFAKAQGEFAHGVATNKDVQKAAAAAVAQGYNN